MQRSKTVIYPGGAKVPEHRRKQSQTQSKNANKRPQNKPFERDFYHTGTTSPQVQQTISKTVCIDDYNINLHNFKQYGFDTVMPELKGDFKKFFEKNASGITICTDDPKPNTRVKLLERLKQSKSNNCKCEKCEGFVDCLAWCEKHLNFGAHDQTGAPFLQSESKKEVTMIKKFNNKVLLHGPIIPKPVFSLDRTFISEQIQHNLTFASSKDIQSYAWPAIQRGLNVFLISPPRSGKTLSYLPMFCSFCLQKKDRYAKIEQYEGPLALILCPNNANCEDLVALARELSPECEVEMLGKNGGSEMDILITTASLLEPAVRSGSIRLKRLCHLAIEDAHFVLKTNEQIMQNLFRVVNEVKKSRPYNNNVQIVLSSEKWSSHLEQLLRSLYTSPIVCFEDFLEAAMYGKVRFLKKKLKATYKKFYLQDILKANFLLSKTVVFLNEEDIDDVVEFFQLSGIEYIIISSQMIEDEIFEQEDRWNSLTLGHYKVLLCTDAVFEKIVHILNAHWLVHYCLPTNWHEFRNRFRCLAANLGSPLEAQADISLSSFMIIDEQCSDQWFLDFLEVMTRNSILNSQQP